MLRCTEIRKRKDKVLFIFKNAKMPVSCAAYGCKNRYEGKSSLQFFTFPLKYPEKLSLWVKAMRRKDWIPTKSSRICSEHFLPSDFLERPGILVPKLKDCAVPSVFQPFPDHLKTEKKIRKISNKSAFSVGGKNDIFQLSKVDNKNQKRKHVKDDACASKRPYRKKTEVAEGSLLKKEIRSKKEIQSKKLETRSKKEETRMKKEETRMKKEIRTEKEEILMKKEDIRTKKEEIQTKKEPILDVTAVSSESSMTCQVPVQTIQSERTENLSKMKKIKNKKKLKKKHIKKENIKDLSSAQKQADAMLALFKQLEITLLHIPTLKLPPPEMHFIPDGDNQEFIMLLGLEKVVDIIAMYSDHIVPPTPFTCVQCSTDFAPVWKWQYRYTSGRLGTSVICGNCLTINIKKALKAEQMNYFTKAVFKTLQQHQQQQQEIGQPIVIPSPFSSTIPSHAQSSSLTTVVGSEASSTSQNSHFTPFTKLGNDDCYSTDFLEFVHKLAAYHSFLQVQTHL